MAEQPLQQRRAILAQQLQEAEQQLARWQQQVAFLLAWLADLGPPVAAVAPNRAARRRAGKGAPVTSP